MQVPRLMAPGLTLGAALSNSTRERPCASLPVTTRRIGFIPSGMGVLLGSGFVYIARPVRTKERPHEHEGASVGPGGRRDGDQRRRLVGAQSRTGAGFAQPA